MSDPVGFIGAGNMATALAKGMIGAGLVAAEQVYAGDPDPARRTAFCAATGVPESNAGDNNESVATSAPLLFLCVKPQQAAAVLKPLAPVMSAGHTLVSILAGTRSADVHRLAGGNAAVIRVMPNTPMLVGEGASAMAPGPGANNAVVERVQACLSACGRVVQVPEEAMDPVTALSGSGPAYVFYLAEAMLAAGAEMGLNAADARNLTIQTLRGAAELLDRSGNAPEELRKQVTSPGGTTQAALEHLENNGVKRAWMDAILQARARAVELSTAVRDNGS